MLSLFPPFLIVQGPGPRNRGNPQWVDHLDSIQSRQSLCTCPEASVLGDSSSQVTPTVTWHSLSLSLCSLEEKGLFCVVYKLADFYLDLFKRTYRLSFQQEFESCMSSQGHVSSPLRAFGVGRLGGLVSIGACLPWKRTVGALSPPFSLLHFLGGFVQPNTSTTCPHNVSPQPQSHRSKLPGTTTSGL